MTYPAAFALKEPALSKAIPDADIWHPASKLAAVDGLLDALHERA